VTSRGYVLLIDMLTRTLNVYGSDAVLVHSVALAVDLRYPFHAVETCTGNFIICHLGKDDQISRVSEIQRNGLLIRTYGVDELSRVEG